MSERVEAVAEEEVGNENLQEAVETQSGPQAQAADAPEAETPIPEATPAAEATQEASTAQATEADESQDATGENPSEETAAAVNAGPEAEVQAERSEQVSQDSTENDSTENDSTENDATENDATASPEGSSAGSEEDSESQSEKKVVRTLAVGEVVVGTVKRIADFGAFVDIGVGRDGLIHISELSVRRVGKVTDVLQEGQEVSAWIKKLDRDRNRISLTLIDPDTKTIRDLQKGDVVTGRVTRLLPYGAFVDIGIGRDALLHVREMAEGFVAKPEDVVKVDEELEARVIDLSRRRSRVDLSLKGLRPEPEAAVPHHSDTQQSQAAELEDEEVVEDAFEDVEVLSPMELAFKRAMEAEGMEVKSNKRGRRKGRMSRRDIQDEIISRTLTDSGR